MRSKRLVITGISAMQAWDEGAMAYARPSKVTSPQSCASTSAELAAFTTLPSGCTVPVHIMVGDDMRRIRSQHWRTHQRRALLASGALLDIGDNRLIISPEEFYRCASPSLTVVQAVLLGMELCGSYSTLMSVPYRCYCNQQVRDRLISFGDKPWPPSEWDMSVVHQRELMDNGFINREALTTPEGISRYLDAALATRSHTTARTASRFVQVGSHSPMESRLFARYCLPRCYGGLNLKPVELNAEIPLSKDVAQSIGITGYSVDLLWRDACTAIEYEGESSHVGLTAAQKDRLKRNILEMTGIRIISIDNKQFANDDMMDMYGEQIAHGLGIPKCRLALKPNERRARYALLDDIHRWDFDLYRN